MPTTNSVDACDYFKFWWDTKSVSAYGMTAVPMQILTSAFPGTDFNRKEFMLLDRQTNSMKEGYVLSSICLASNPSILPAYPEIITDFLSKNKKSVG